MADLLSATKPEGIQSNRAIKSAACSRIHRGTSPMYSSPSREPRLGFAAPEDRLISLNVAAAFDGQQHPSYSFDIEYDAEVPGHVVVRLLELDRDYFIRTVQVSLPIPVGMLADLVQQRKATAEEIASWQNTPADEIEALCMQSRSAA